MRPTVIYSHNNGRGSRVIAEALGIHRLRHHGSRYRPGPNKVLINWGAHELPPIAARFGRVVNTPAAIANVADKLRFFRHVVPTDTVRIPDYTTHREIAQGWAASGTVVVRHILNGSSGHGIEIIRRGGTVPAAPLYTRYIKKDEEYRVHVVGDQAIFKQQKIRRDGAEPTNWHVRSLENGFIYRQRTTPTVSDESTQAVRAVRAVGLDFGAVDVVTKDGLAYVLEVNSAPGIDPNSHLKDAYADAFRQLIGN